MIPLQSETREQSSLFHSLASNNPGQQGVQKHLFPQTRKPSNNTELQIIDDKFEYKRILIQQNSSNLFSLSI